MLRAEECAEEAAHDGDGVFHCGPGDGGGGDGDDYRADRGGVAFLAEVGAEVGSDDGGVQEDDDFEDLVAEEEVDDSDDDETGGDAGGHLAAPGQQVVLLGPGGWHVGKKGG